MTGVQTCCKHENEVREGALKNTLGCGEVNQKQKKWKEDQGRLGSSNRLLG